MVLYYALSAKVHSNLMIIGSTPNANIELVHVTIGTATVLN